MDCYGVKNYADADWSYGGGGGVEGVRIPGFSGGADAAVHREDWVSGGTGAIDAGEDVLIISGNRSVTGFV